MKNLILSLAAHALAESFKSDEDLPHQLCSLILKWLGAV